MMPGFIKSLLNGGKLLEGAKSIIDEIVTTKEEKAQLEIRFKELINEHEQALINAEVDDRKSARQREVDAIKSGSKNLTQNILAYAAIVAFFSITGYIISHGLGKMNSEESFIIGNLTGMAAAIAKDIYGYYFGSSKGEHDASSQKPLFKK
ncbi:MAG: hypothetical protein DI538_20755 [Azospira oryzae]|nr:MAG: hypothetical protein DI538_20755 [Azospira oryzae]